MTPNRNQTSATVPDGTYPMIVSALRGETVALVSPADNVGIVVANCNDFPDGTLREEEKLIVTIEDNSVVDAVQAERVSPVEHPFVASTVKEVESGQSQVPLSRSSVIR